MPERGRGDAREVSRRGLFGAFRRSARALRAGLDDVQHAAASAGPAPRAGAASAPSYPRLLRPAEQVVTAYATGHSAWTLALGERAPEAGGSVVVVGGGLPEPLVVVRVNAQHWASCTAECPIDGSHVDWDGALDRLVCPACRSQWRLDGDCMGPPADSPLARLVVDAYVDDDGGVEARVHLP